MITVLKEHVRKRKLRSEVEAKAAGVGRLGHHELAFLPAALEVQESPPSPVGRAILWTLIALCSSAIAWAGFSQVDIVAVAPGKLVPGGRVKVVQSVGLGTVRAIHVADGQRVKAGDVLIELDPTFAEADRTRMAEEFSHAEYELARLRTFDHWQGTNQRVPMAEPSDVRLRDPAFGALQLSLLDQSISEQQSRLSALDHGLARRRADLEGTRQQLEKLRRILPLIEERAASVAKLLQTNLVSRTQYLELEQERIAAVQDLASQESTLVATQSAIEELLQQRRTLQSESRRETLTRIEELEKKVSEFRQEHIKATQVASLQVLTAPVSGEVQELAVHTIGGVIEPGKPLLVIVPGDQTLEVEALVPNKDIGFVREGQSVAVKIDSFPFTRYGLIDGTVISVSDDAIQHERLGLVYTARVQMERTSMEIDGRTIQLSPGMGVSAEVKTGKRRVAEFLLSPVARSASESMRER
jgi:hemolysin D